MQLVQRGVDGVELCVRPLKPGSLLHLLLDDIAGRFVPDDPRAMSHLRRCFALEDRLIADGTLQHDFAMIVAQPKTHQFTAP